MMSKIIYLFILAQGKNPCGTMFCTSNCSCLTLRQCLDGLFQPAALFHRCFLFNQWLHSENYFLKPQSLNRRNSGFGTKRFSLYSSCSFLFCSLKSSRKKITNWTTNAWQNLLLAVAHYVETKPKSLFTSWKSQTDFVWWRIIWCNLLINLLNQG